MNRGAGIVIIICREAGKVICREAGKVICREAGEKILTILLVMKGSFLQIWALFKKDLLLEVRQQYSFYGVLLYVASTIFVLYLAMGQPDGVVWKGLFWMIQLFVCVNAVAKSFLQEGRGRLLYFYSITGAANFILSKLLFNALLMLLMSMLSLGLFVLMLGDPMPEPVLFVGISWLGGVSLSLVFTFLAAIAARAQQSAALMAILGFPLVIPQLLLLSKISNIAFADVLQGGLGWMIVVLVALDVMIVVLSLILFPFLWKD
jgi:heme exporter protein B